MMLKKQLKHFKTNKEKVYSRIDKITWNGLNVIPSDYHLDYAQVLGNVDYRKDSYTVSIALPEKSVINDNNDLPSQNMVVNVNPITEFEYPEFTLKLPFIPELNEFFSRQLLFDPWKLRIQKEGIGLIQEVSNNVINLYPIPNLKLIKKIFDYVAIQARISQAGRIAY